MARPDWKSQYFTFCRVISHAAFIFVLLNIALAIVPRSWAPYQQSSERTESLGVGNLDSALLDDFHSFFATKRPLIPYVGPGEPVFQSKTITVTRDKKSQIPIRVTEPQLQSTKTLLLLGGTKAFGLYLSDSETLASQLQQKLVSDQMRVLNFTMRDQSPREQLMLFQRLVRLGHKPQFVVAINEGEAGSQRWHRGMARLWQKKQEGSLEAPWPSRVPILFWLEQLRAQAQFRLQPVVNPPPQDSLPYYEMLDAVVAAAGGHLLSINLGSHASSLSSSDREELTTTIVRSLAGKKRPQVEKNTL